MDITAGNLAAGILFGSLGFFFMRRAIKDGNGRAILLGLTLMVFPYFISNAWIEWLVGSALSYWAFRLLQ